MCLTCHITSARPSHTDWLWWSWTDSRPATCQSADESRKYRWIIPLFIITSLQSHWIMSNKSKNETQMAFLSFCSIFYLWESDTERHSCNNGHVSFHEGSDQLIAALNQRGHRLVCRHDAEAVVSGAAGRKGFKKQGEESARRTWW